MCVCVRLCLCLRLVITETAAATTGKTAEEVMSDRETTKDILRQRLKEKRGGTQSNIETSSAPVVVERPRG